MDCFRIILPTFWTERHIIPVLKVVVEGSARMHPCPQIQLLFEDHQLGAKLEILALYLKDLVLQIEDQLHQLGVARFFHYFSDLVERAQWIHLRHPLYIYFAFSRSLSARFRLPNGELAASKKAGDRCRNQEQPDCQEEAKR